MGGSSIWLSLWSCDLSERKTLYRVALLTLTASGAFLFVNRFHKHNGGL